MKADHQTSGRKPSRKPSRKLEWLQAQRRKLLVAAAAGMSSALVLLAGCGPVKLVASTNIPPPLVVKVPIGVALFIPTDFSSYVHKEERWSTNWHIELGKAQSEGITRLMGAMFERVVTVESVNAGTQIPGGVAAILEPSIEEYAFVTPRDAGSPFYAVSIKYRVNVYLPDGKLADSWGFTGYGTSPAQGLSSEAPLSAATALAMRDAGAKLAVEFREQAVMRGIMPGAPTADAPPTETPAAPGASTTPEAPGASTTPAAPGASTAPAPGTSTTPAPTTLPAPKVIETPAAESGKTAPPSSPPPAAPAPAEDAAKEEEAPKEETDGGEPTPTTEDAAGEPKQTEKKIPKQPTEPEAFAVAKPS